MARRTTLSYEQHRDVWARWSRGECMADIARLRFRENLCGTCSYQPVGSPRRRADARHAACPSRSARRFHEALRQGSP